MEIDSSRWKLPDELIELSEGNRYPAVLSEWKLSHIDELEQGEDSETCLCHHHPIREVCHIRNTINGNSAIVGNCCVKKFEGETAFKGTHKIFAALKRIKNDKTASANRELIKYAYKRGIINERSYLFYKSIWRKRNLTDGQETWKIRLNKKIVKHTNPTTRHQVIHTVARHQIAPAPQAATASQPAIARVTQPVAIPQPVRDPLAELRTTPTKIASPTLLRRAFSQQAIPQKDFDFYNSIIQRRVKTPSDKQQRWINDINGRILNNMGGISH